MPTHGRFAILGLLAAFDSLLTMLLAPARWQAVDATAPLSHAAVARRRGNDVVGVVMVGNG